MKPLSESAAEPAPSGRPDLAVPSLGEAPRLPRDYGIGPIGAGGAEPEAYRAALELLSLAAAGKPSADRFLEDGERRAAALSARLAELGASPTLRAGSPVRAPDGSLSFLIRALGRDASASGELHLRRTEEGRWLASDALLELDPPGDPESAAGPFDPLSYNRFL